MIFVGMQWWEMHQTGKQLDQQIGIARTQAEAARKQTLVALLAVKAGRDQASASLLLAKAGRDQASAMSVAANAAKQEVLINSKALSVNNEMLKDQRRVEVTLGIQDYNVAVGERPEAHIIITNVGSTNISHATSTADIAVTKPGESIKVFNNMTYKAEENLGPTGVSITHIVSPSYLKQSTMDALRAGLITLVIGGRITFSDAAGKEKRRYVCGEIGRHINGVDLQDCPVPSDGR